MDELKRQPVPASAAAPRAASTQPPPHAARAWLPRLVLCLSLAVTAVAATYVHHTIAAQDHARFKHDVERNRTALANRLDNYIGAVRNVRALFEAAGILNRGQLHRYLARVDLRSNYPGMQAIGFSVRIAGADLAKATKGLREKHDPTFEVWPASPPREEYHAILHLEPSEDESNRRAYGWDMHTEQVRADAMDTACLSGAATASGKVRLLQDASVQPWKAAFVVYMPLYAGNVLPTEDKRRENLIGFIFGAFRADDLLEGLLASDPHPMVDFRLYDGAGERPDRFLHDSADLRRRIATGGDTVDRGESAPRFQHLETITVLNRPWTLRWVSRQEATAGRWLTPLIAVVGTLVSFTLFALTRTQGRAITAGRRTMAELERSRNDLQDAKVAAESANSAKDRFLAVLSHELRTPLAPVLLAVSLWERDEKLPQELRGDLGTIRRNVELEARLIDDLLDLTRVGRGKLHLDVTDVDVHAAVRHALDVGPCREAAVKQIDLTCRLDAADANVRGDAARLQQVFWNLLHNAVKFTPPLGGIDVRTSTPAPGRIRVEVSDSGIGLQPEEIAKIFDAFEQGAAARSRESGGLGLGLAIARGLVVAHGGTVEAQSRGPGRGATFVIELPTAPVTDKPSSPPLVKVSPNARAGAPRGADEADGTDGKLPILVVEDHVDSARMLERLLVSAGYAPRVAENVVDAIRTGREQRFGLLLSDLALPDGSGIDVLRALRERGPNVDIPAIALSGHGMPDDIGSTEAAGFCEHLTKPIDMDRLQAAISRATGHIRRKTL
jgi:signal transduction histidine kinase/ActR/RegA family two-component response regulator